MKEPIPDKREEISELEISEEDEAEVEAEESKEQINQMEEKKVITLPIKPLEFGDNSEEKYLADLSASQTLVYIT